jgi:paraquat-inducible protein A
VIPDRSSGVSRTEEQKKPSDAESAEIECEFCGLHQADAELREGERAKCARCGSTIRFRKPASIERSLALAICGLLLFVPANAFAIMTFTVMGSWNDNRVLTGVAGLFKDGAHIIGLLVLVASFLAPLARFVCAFAVLLPIHLGRPELSSSRLHKMLEGLDRWAMLDVYLLAIVVAYAKLSNFGTSELAIGWYPLVGLILVSIALSISYDPEAVTEAKGAAHEASAEPVSHKSLRVTEALLLTGAIFFIPSYVLPVLRLVEYGAVHDDTVYAAVLELTSGGQYVLGILMFCASIVIPTMKLLTLTFLVVSIRLRWNFRMSDRLMLYRIVEAIGRWSFVDLFVVSILIALAELGVFATASAGPGLVFFAGVVLSTMLAAMSLDPRLIWNPARPIDDV